MKLVPLTFRFAVAGCSPIRMVFEVPSLIPDGGVDSVSENVPVIGAGIDARCTCAKKVALKPSYSSAGSDSVIDVGTRIGTETTRDVLPTCTVSRALRPASEAFASRIGTAEKPTRSVRGGAAVVMLDVISRPFAENAPVAVTRSRLNVTVAFGGKFAPDAVS